MAGAGIQTFQKFDEGNPDRIFERADKSWFEGWKELSKELSKELIHNLGINLFYLRYKKCLFYMSLF